VSAYAIPVGLPRRRRIVTPVEWLREEIDERRRAREDTIVQAACTHLINTPSSSNTASYPAGAVVPAVGSLLLVLGTHTATLTNIPTSVTDDQGGTYTLIRDQSRGSQEVWAWVRDSFISSAVSTICTVTHNTVNGTPTGCVIDVCQVTGMSKVGSAAIRSVSGTPQVASANGASSTTPAPSLPAAADTNNPTIGLVCNLTNPATLTPPAGWTERADAGYTTPTTGFEYVTRDSGFTGTTITWGAVSATAHADIIFELDASAPTAVSRPLVRIVSQAVMRAAQR
jgi:hypothetical protein